jgi:hypothetical protein
MDQPAAARHARRPTMPGKYLKVEIQTEPLLRPGFDADEGSKKMLKNFTGKSLMWSGMKPDFTRTIFPADRRHTKTA